MRARRRHSPGQLRVLRYTFNAVEIKLFGLPGQESKPWEELSRADRHYFGNLNPSLEWHRIVAVPAAPPPEAPPLPPPYPPDEPGTVSG
jgi:hypothetical protein